MNFNYVKLSRIWRNPHFYGGIRKNLSTLIPRKGCEIDCSGNFYKNEKISSKSASQK